MRERENRKFFPHLRFRLRFARCFGQDSRNLVLLRCDSWQGAVIPGKELMERVSQTLSWGLRHHRRQRLLLSLRLHHVLE